MEILLQKKKSNGFQGRILEKLKSNIENIYSTKYSKKDKQFINQTQYQFKPIYQLLSDENIKKKQVVKKTNTEPNLIEQYLQEKYANIYSEYQFDKKIQQFLKFRNNLIIQFDPNSSVQSNKVGQNTQTSQFKLQQMHLKQTTPSISSKIQQRNSPLGFDSNQKSSLNNTKIQENLPENQLNSVKQIYKSRKNFKIEQLRQSLGLCPKNLRKEQEQQQKIAKEIFKIDSRMLKINSKIQQTTSTSKRQHKYRIKKNQSSNLIKNNEKTVKKEPEQFQQYFRITTKGNLKNFKRDSENKSITKESTQKHISVKTINRTLSNNNQNVKQSECDSTSNNVLMKRINSILGKRVDEKYELVLPVCTETRFFNKNEEVNLQINQELLQDIYIEMSLHQERATKVFDRLQNIQNQGESERLSKWKFFLSLINTLEQKVEELYNQKIDKFESLNCQIKLLFEEIHIQKNSQEKTDIQVQTTIGKTHKNCVNLLNNFSKEREESERRIFQKLTNQIDIIAIEIHKEYEAKTASQNYLQNQIEQELPRFMEEIRQESAHREEIEQTIYGQFSEQIQELKDMFEVERKEREIREEELINILKVIYSKINQAISKCSMDREKSEEMLVKLIEQVIDKIKTEIQEQDF